MSGYRRVVVAIAAAVLLIAVGVPAAGAAAGGQYGLATVKLQTAATGGGIHPVLKWKAVPGAAQYRVVVRDAKKRPYWAWVGTANRVVVSATGKPVAKTTPVGPRVGKNYRWSVAAFDAAGKPVALSREQPISP